MTQQDLKTLWELYKTFCAEGARNVALRTDSATAFLGWLEYRDELGSGRYLNGVTDGFKQARKSVTEFNTTDSNINVYDKTLAPKLSPKKPFVSDSTGADIEHKGS